MEIGFLIVTEEDFFFSRKIIFGICDMHKDKFQKNEIAQAS